jgi:pimeloyl-ACP methyl ester carboxylesterase
MKLYYQEQGEGPALIIIHGLFGSSDNWRSMAKYFSRFARVISIDLRNHGRSPHSDSQTFVEMAGDLIELMDELGVQSATLLGHSLGGKVAMQCAETYPDRVERLVIVDMSLRQYFSPHTPLMDAMMAIDFEQVSQRPQVDDALAKTINDAAVRQFLLMNLKSENGHFFWRINVPALKANYINLMSAVCQQANISVPSFFIYGGESDYVTDADIDVINMHFNQASFYKIEGAGHWVHAEKPQLFKRVVEEFLT